MIGSSEPIHYYYGRPQAQLATLRGDIGCGVDTSQNQTSWERGDRSPSRRQFTRNRATYGSEALALAVQGEQRVLRTEAAVHLPERIMRQSASRIAQECFRLNYQIPPALACRRSNVDAA